MSKCTSRIRAARPQLQGWLAPSLPPSRKATVRHSQSEAALGCMPTSSYATGIPSQPGLAQPLATRSACTEKPSWPLLGGGRLSPPSLTPFSSGGGKAHPCPTLCSQGLGIVKYTEQA